MRPDPNCKAATGGPCTCYGQAVDHAPAVVPLSSRFAEQAGTALDKNQWSAAILLAETAARLKREGM